MENKLTNSAKRLEGQPMFRLLDQIKELEKAGRNIIHFEIGDPDFKTPQPVIDRCIQSLHSGETHYTSSYGLPELREAIADYTLKDMGFRPQLEQIIVSPGANALIYCVIQCLVKEGEEVIVPDPAFSTYFSVLKFLGLRCMHLPLKEEYQFRMNPQELRKKISPQTKLIILNSPHNPTGSVMTKEEIIEVYQIAEEHDLFILSDEIYRQMSYGEKPFSPAFLDACLKRTILMTGFSKSFAMTGWRLGYLIGSEVLVEKISLLLQTIISCVPPFIQRAGIAVLERELIETRRMMNELQARREVIVEGLNQLPGVSCLKPEGAFYVFPNIVKTGLTSEQFARLMLEEAGVALLPGGNFGQAGDGYVRLCYATSIPKIREGLSRMAQVLRNRVGFVEDLKEDVGVGQRT